jgi:hypothetical protein
MFHHIPFLPRLQGLAAFYAPAVNFSAPKRMVCDMIKAGPARQPAGAGRQKKVIEVEAV